MEFSALPNTVHVTESIYEALCYTFELEARGHIDIKGKGKLQTYILKGRLAHKVPTF
jgi:hypothetical protein